MNSVLIKYRPWIVCLGTAFSMFVVMGLGVNAFTVFQPSLISVRHFTNAQASWLTTTRSLFSLLSLVSAEKLCTRLGEYRTMIIGNLLFTLSSVIFSVTSTFDLNLLASALCGLGYGYGGMVPLSTILSRWFDKHRGTALGLAAAGSGAAAVIMPPVLAGIIESEGLSQAFLWEAALGGVMTVLVILFVKNSPPEYKISHHSNDKSCISFHADKNFLLILAAAFLLGAPAGPGFSHLTVLYQQAGLSPAYTSWLISYLGLMLIVGKILYGYLSDQLGGYRANMLAFFALTSGMLLCCFAPVNSIPLDFFSITLVGLGLPLSSVALAVFAEDFSTADLFQSHLQLITCVYMIGSLCLGPVPGMLADYFNTYIPAYILFSCMTVGGMALVWKSYAGNKM